MACNNTSFISGPEARIIARDSVTVFTEICAIQQAILSAISNCPGPGNYSTIVPMPIYADITGPVDAEFIGVLDLPTRTLVSAIVTTAGSGYPANTTLDISFTPDGEVAILGSATTDGDSITDIQIISGGSGYVGGEAVIIDDLGIAPTTLATAEVDSVSPDKGIISAITITDGGTGYTVNGEGNIASPALLQAVGIVTSDANGDILIGSPITITNPGHGFVTAPAFTVPNPLSPIPTFAPATPMTTTLDVAPVDGKPDSWMYYEAFTGLLDSPEIEDQLAYVKSYFTALGYNIQIQVNPHTMNTIQWSIIW